MKYLPLFHHFKAIYQFPKHIIFLVKIVANASSLSVSIEHQSVYKNQFQLLFILFLHPFYAIKLKFYHFNKNIQSFIYSQITLHLVHLN